EPGAPGQRTPDAVERISGLWLGPSAVAVSRYPESALMQRSQRWLAGFRLRVSVAVDELRGGHRDDAECSHPVQPRPVHGEVSAVLKPVPVIGTRIVLQCALERRQCHIDGLG